jgi:hypothetical protein
MQLQHKKRPELVDKMEELLPTSIDQTERKSSADLINIKEKAKFIYDSIKNNYPSDEVKGFNGSSSNFHKFKQYYCFHKLKLNRRMRFQLLKRI